MRMISLAIMATIASLGAAAPLAAQTAGDQQRFDAAQARFDREYQIFRDEMARYRSSSARGGSYRDPAYDNGQYRRAGDPYANTDDRDENGYDAARYYRSGNTYRERTLGADERVYAGQDGRYYCRRSDGTTGLIVGGAAGGVLGNVIDGGHSRAVGTLLGGAIGALAGRQIDQNQSEVRCR